MSVKTTDKEFSRIIPMVEEHYKMGVTTDVGCNSVFYNMVEENYKMVVTTTEMDGLLVAPMVEEHYKEIKTSYFDPPYNPESVMDSEITNQPVTDWSYNENFVNELYKQNTNG